MVLRRLEGQSTMVPAPVLLPLFARMLIGGMVFVAGALSVALIRPHKDKTNEAPDASKPQKGDWHEPR